MKTVLPERERPVTPRRRVGCAKPVAKSTRPLAASFVPSIMSLNFKPYRPFLDHTHNWGLNGGKQGKVCGSHLANVFQIKGRGLIEVIDPVAKEQMSMTPPAILWSGFWIVAGKIVDGHANDFACFYITCIFIT
jgi:hypothetical protein